MLVTSAEIFFSCAAHLHKENLNNMESVLSYVCVPKKEAFQPYSLMTNPGLQTPQPPWFIRGGLFSPAPCPRGPWRTWRQLAALVALSKEVGGPMKWRFNGKFLRAADEGGGGGGGVGVLPPRRAGGTLGGFRSGP